MSFFDFSEEKSKKDIRSKYYTALNEGSVGNKTYCCLRQKTPNMLLIFYPMHTLRALLKKYRNETIVGVLVFVFFLCRDVIKSIIEAF